MPDNLISPFPDLPVLKLYARKCPSLGCLPFMLHQQSIINTNSVMMRNLKNSLRTHESLFCVRYDICGMTSSLIRWIKCAPCKN